MAKAPFDWMDPRRNPERAKIEKARREAMYRTELEERAALLQRLGYAKDKARARLAANLAWDFDGKSPLDAGALDAIVDRVFNGASTGRPPPRGKGGTR
jgi:acyl-CoA reductase-like NAD-dependent aldehyde dehydrogenase